MAKIIKGEKQTIDSEIEEHKIEEPKIELIKKKRLMKPNEKLGMWLILAIFFLILFVSVMAMYSMGLKTGFNDGRDYQQGSLNLPYYMIKSGTPAYRPNSYSTTQSTATISRYKKTEVKQNGIKEKSWSN
jgi:hypothetical protein